MKQSSASANRSKVRTLAETAIMAAVLCLLGPLSIPIGPIPVSLTPFAVFLTAYLLGRVQGTVAYCVYLLIGLVGLPVFSGFQGGAQKLFGPTGGYLLSFILMTWIAGLFFEKFRSIPLQFLGCAVALCVSYTFGTLWLAWQAQMSIAAAVAAAVLPFIGFDLVKIAAAIALGRLVQAALTRANRAAVEHKSLASTEPATAFSSDNVKTDDGNPSA